MGIRIVKDLSLGIKILSSAPNFYYLIPWANTGGTALEFIYANIQSGGGLHYVAVRSIGSAPINLTGLTYEILVRRTDL
jgi:hypothetical protein